MPTRLKQSKRRPATQVTSEALAIFKRGMELLQGPHDPLQMRDHRVALAAALGRSKFRACPLDPRPRSLIGGDTEPVEAVLDLRACLLKEIGKVNAR
jgi:hypothetical protein